MLHLRHRRRLAFCTRTLAEQSPQFSGGMPFASAAGDEGVLCWPSLARRQCAKATYGDVCWSRQVARAAA
jgi:hypothetical protein